MPDVSPLVRVRRTLRGIRPLRRAYYWALQTFTKPADPLSLRLIDEERFRECIRRLVVLMKARGQVGDYLEFGVFNGTSLSIVFHAFRVENLTRSRFYGFDSFQGLPEDEDGLWLSGQCACSLDAATAFLTERGVDWNRVHLIKGWFSETLTPELASGIYKASLIMIDCDLYSSAREALAFVAPLIRDEAIVIFDDWHGFQAAEKGLGEMKAFAEFLHAHPEFGLTELDISYSEEAKILRLTRTVTSDPAPA